MLLKIPKHLYYMMGFHIATALALYMVFRGYSITLEEVESRTELIYTSRPFGAIVGLSLVSLFHLLVIVEKRLNLGPDATLKIIFIGIFLVISSGFFMDFLVDNHIKNSGYIECKNLKERMNITTFNYYSYSGNCIKPE